MTQQVTRNRKILTYRYDAAGRDTLWIMPSQGTFMYDSTHTAAADTVRSKFDSLGNLLVHSNRLGSIIRRYANSGVITNEVRRAAPSGPHLVADSVQMAYDRFGRLDTLRWVGDAVRYRYAATGDLEEIFTDWKNGGATRHDSVGFHWDSLGRRQQVKYPYNSMTATSHFDRLGMVRRMMVANSAPAAGNRFIDSLVQDKVDLLGRPLHQRIVCPGMTSNDAGNPCGEWRPADDTTKYNRPGQVVIQALLGTTHWTTDTFNYDRSGNRTYHAHRDITSVLSNFTYPDSSNRVAVQADSTPGTGRQNQHFVYDSLGARRVMFSIDAPADTFVLKIYQYDAAGRLMGSAIGSRAHPPLTIVSANICAYDADTRSVQPCGGGAVTLLGDQVIHDPNGNWFYVYAPGIDEPILAIRRNPVDTTELARLDMVSNGNGQVVAIADSAGQLNAIYAQAIPGSNGGPWGSGLTSRGQTFDPRRWATAIGGDTISTFRTRQYDPGTGKWLQEDPIGIAGGVNLYQYNGNDPNSFSDPFGLCPKDAGGDGRTGVYSDCPKGTKGHDMDMAGVAGHPTFDPVAVLAGGLIGLVEGVAAAATTEIAVAGESSMYEVGTTGRSIANRVTDVTRHEFEGNLIQSGFSEQASSGGGIRGFAKDAVRYVTRPTSSGGKATAELFLGEKRVLKIRLKPDQ